MSIFTRDENVKQQYSSDMNLSARYKLHDKHSTNKQGFIPWLVEQYDFKENDKILELGCGNGRQWDGRISTLPAGCSLILTDISQGMISTAKERLSAGSNVRFLQMDIQDIPYADESFDIVIANHMLFHVPDLDKGLSEVRRVLKANGRFYSTTNSNGGLRQYFHNVFKKFDPDTDAFTNMLTFDLDNGGEILRRHFAHVERRDYEDSLAVTDTRDLMDWLESTITMSGYLSDKFTGLYDYFEAIRVEIGSIDIPKEQGLFICTK